MLKPLKTTLYEIHAWTIIYIIFVDFNIKNLQVKLQIIFFPISHGITIELMFKKFNV